MSTMRSMVLGSLMILPLLILGCAPVEVYQGGGGPLYPYHHLEVLEAPHIYTSHYEAARADYYYNGDGYRARQERREIGAALREIDGGRREIRRDRQELDRSIRERRVDESELRRDIRGGAAPAEIAHDRREIHEDLNKIAEERRELHQDWNELQGDRRKLNRERLELRRDLREGVW